MNTKGQYTVGAHRFTAMILSLAGALLMTGTIGSAQSSGSISRNAIEGTWLVSVTLRNCDTNAPQGSFSSLVSFHEGGTLSETTASSAFAVGQRSPGHGNWTSEGPRTYRQRMISLINFDTAANLPGVPGFNPALPVTPGFFTGTAIVTQTLEMTDANHLSSVGTNEFFRADGTSYRTGCSTAVATRFE